ncbi:LacI family DNA-binding transcriptional regulator [Paenibacillus sp. LHD-117]|uniref:LacI family DNA-binding transcriptional regulator n=1 Tax=Paenibacillus sp. LHD-117 TaxID=3071412 RepID=UPI0027DF8F49|nr:LacI family DNA-binding transcriptional regulator [Paenibacillus sp. LHD-117]MDQ6423366.1 LacI family DNA-binding transcriptional regulator [Paenibacillus sp. LHD-117]
MARLAGVSEATVSRVLNNVGPIKEETKQRVLRAAAEVGYVPSALAQQFARRKSGNIGVILPSVPKVHLFSTYYFSEILSGIGEAAKRFGYDLLLIFQEPGDSRDYAGLFRKQKVDACIMLGSQDVAEEREALAELAEAEYPFCLVNQRFEGYPFPSVDADHVSGSKLAVEHLLRQGRKRIAFLNGPGRYSNSMDRLEGYASALSDNGMALDDGLMFQGNYSRKSGYLLAPIIGEAIRGGRIDAVFAANDRMAIGLLQGLKEQGFEAPLHYGLVGYDDSDGSRIISPRLTTVAVPFYEMGKLAAEMLLDADRQSGHAASGGDAMLPVHLVPRETS